MRDIAVLVEPLTIAEKGLAQVWNIQQRLPWGCPVIPGKAQAHCHKAVVLGAGPVGLLGAMALVNADFDTYVYAREPAPNRQIRGARNDRRAIPLGADSFARTARGEIGNVDLVYEATGASRLAFDMMQYLGTNGIFIFTGVPGRKGPVEIDTDLVMRNLVLKNQVVFGTVNAGRDIFETAIHDLQTFNDTWPEAVRSLITGRFGMNDHRELLLGKATGIKNVIQLN